MAGILSNIKNLDERNLPEMGGTLGFRTSWVEEKAQTHFYNSIQSPNYSIRWAKYNCIQLADMLLLIAII